MRVSLLIVAAAAVAALAAAPAAGKDGARARLMTALPLDAAPGTTLAVGWRVDVPDQSGGRQPFGAGGMFVRLLSRTGAPATTAFASGTEHADGRYAAEVTVPAGGIGGVRLGLRGWNDRGTADVLFPLENDPFASAGGARCDVSVLRATLNAFVGAFDRGDLRRLDGVFARDSFVWYSVGPPAARLGDDAYRRDTLISYFRTRHAHGDRLSLLTFRFNSYDRQRELGHFELTARRRAADFQGGSWFRISGKGALDCAKPPVRIAVMSLGGARR